MKIGDTVQKTNGDFVMIVAAYNKSSGEPRFVVEDRRGRDSIVHPRQLKQIEDEP